MYNWKRWKGISKGKEYCWKCGKYVDETEFDYDNDICLYCEFPETSPIKPAEYDYSYGYRKNVTTMEKFLEEYEDLPEKSSIEGEAKRVGLKLPKKTNKRKYKKTGKYTTEKLKEKKTSKKRRKKNPSKPKNL